MVIPCPVNTRLVFQGLFISVLILISVHSRAAKPDTENPIIFVGDSSYAPFEFTDTQGNPKGIFVDIWKLWSRKTGISLDYRCMKWTDAIDAVTRGEAHVLGGVFYTEERANVFDFPKSYMEITTSIFFHRSIYGIKGPGDLQGFNIGAVEGDSAVEMLKKADPELRIRLFGSYEDMIRAAALGKIVVFICDTPVALFHLAKTDSAGDFKYTAAPVFRNKVFAAILKQTPELNRQILAGFRMITMDEIHSIEKKWTGIPAEKRIPWTMVLMAGLLMATLSSIVFLWNMQLRRKVSLATIHLEERVKERTREIQTSNDLLQNEVVERKKVQRKLPSEEEKFRTLVSNIPGAVYRILYGNSRSILFLSEAILQVTGLPASHFTTGKASLEAIIHPDDSEALKASIGQAISKGKSFDQHYRIIHADGKIRWVHEHGRGITDKKGDILYLDGVIWDITHRKNTAEKLAQSQKQLHSIIKTVPDIIYRLDDSGKITFISDAVSLYGYTPDELKGTSVLDIVSPEERDAIIEKIGTTPPRKSRRRSFEVRLITKDKALVPFEIFSIVLSDKDREVPGENPWKIQGIARDITNRKKIEEEREKLISELRKALAEIKDLSGLLPICAYCKKVRDDKGYWQQIETYIESRSKAKFSHGMCNECFRIHQPDIYKKLLDDGKLDPET